MDNGRRNDAAEQQSAEAFETKAKALKDLLPCWRETGIVAIEPESGVTFCGATLGKANAAAYAKYPDQWVYCTIENPEVRSLATW